MWLANIKVTTKELIITFFSGFALFLISWYIVAGGQISTIETNVFRLFNDSPNFVASLFAIITYLGTIFTLLVITAILVALKKRYWAIQVFLAGFLAWVAASLIKVAQIRERPFDLLSSVHLTGPTQLSAGFPSAHAALITAAALVLFTNESRKIHWLLVLAVMLVGISRVVIGAHAPLDVIGGVGVGLIVGSFIKLIFLKVSNKKPRIN
jgi:membrane-associated phospholipid phosphatase